MGAAVCAGTCGTAGVPGLDVADGLGGVTACGDAVVIGVRGGGINGRLTVIDVPGLAGRLPC